MEINRLVILGNEFCNYNCEHCLRGPSRNNRMPKETLEKFYLRCLVFMKSRLQEVK